MLYIPVSSKGVFASAFSILPIFAHKNRGIHFLHKALHEWPILLLQYTSAHNILGTTTIAIIIRLSTITTMTQTVGPTLNRSQYIPGCFMGTWAWCIQGHYPSINNCMA